MKLIKFSFDTPQLGEYWCLKMPRGPPLSVNSFGNEAIKGSENINARGWQGLSPLSTVFGGDAIKGQRISILEADGDPPLSVDCVWWQGYQRVGEYRCLKLTESLIVTIQRISMLKAKSSIETIWNAWSWWSPRSRWSPGTIRRICFHRVINNSTDVLNCTYSISPPTLTCSKTQYLQSIARVSCDHLIVMWQNISPHPTRWRNTFSSIQILSLASS